MGLGDGRRLLEEEGGAAFPVALWDRWPEEAGMAGACRAAARLADACRVTGVACRVGSRVVDVSVVLEDGFLVVACR